MQFNFRYLLFTLALTGNAMANEIQKPTFDGPTIVNESNKNFSGFTKLHKHLLPTPYQGNAGTCLYMSHTGVIEWWLSKLNPKVPHTIGGKFDLSERYSVNLSSMDIGDEEVENWRTDTIYRFNVHGQSVRNTHYPFTKGWYKKDENGSRIPARSDDADAVYGPGFNWIHDLPEITGPMVDLPQFDRRVIFADDTLNQWNVGKAPKDIVKQVKEALVKNEAPVIVIYNHFGFWHANIVVGFDDQASTDGCPFSSKFSPYMISRAEELEKESASAESPKEAARLLRKAVKFRTRGEITAKQFKEKGGCNKKGIFHVRDSLYPDESLPVYDYDVTLEGEEKHYSAKIIAREYRWLELFSNHAYQIYPLNN